MFNRYKLLDEILNKYENNKGEILPILKEVKMAYGIISPDLIAYLSDKISLSKTAIEGVVTFYSFLGTGRSGRYVIRICRTISCAMYNKQELIDTLIKEAGVQPGETTSDNLITIAECNCLGMCDQGPSILVNDILIPSVTKQKIQKIISSCKHGTLEKDFSEQNKTNLIRKDHMIEFLEAPIDSDKILSIDPETVIKQITTSDLRGRGGAGFPTGIKWESVRNSASERKILICNADEGEPGTFKDKFLLQNYPEKLILALRVAAKTIGITDIYIYLRGEYTYIYSSLVEEIEKTDQHIEVHLGHGSYVCGEETALIESLEGKRGEPRIKPPYPTQVGYKGFPTVVNNVETFLDVLMILEKGVDYFKTRGTDLSTGTKLFSISGDLPEPGIYELPFGITVKELVDTVKAENIKSVQIGGASGINVSRDSFENVIAFEAIPTGGSIILFDQNRRMIDVAINFMEFFHNESCGVCTPCREGTRELINILHKIKTGSGTMEDIEETLKLCRVITSSSRCGLGQVSTKAYNSILENNYTEFLSYVRREL